MQTVSGILFILLIVVASLVINPNDYKPQIVQMVKAQKQRELTLVGDIDIGSEMLNYLVLATVVGSLEGQGGRELTALNGVTVPVRYTGPFAEPKLTLDFNALVQELHDSIEQPARRRAQSGRFSANFSFPDCSA